MKTDELHPQYKLNQNKRNIGRSADPNAAFLLVNLGRTLAGH
jgi:hypothetical protein